MPRSHHPVRPRNDESRSSRLFRLDADRRNDLGPMIDLASCELSGGCQGGRVRAPPGGGRAKIENSSRRHPRKFGQKRFLAVRRSWRGNGVACFWVATSFGKNLSAAARPRERSKPPWPHLAIHSAEHEFPRLHGLPHAQPATEEAGRSMGAGPELF